MSSDARRLLGELGLAEPPTWRPKVEKKAHPFGEAGIRASLDEVAKRAAQKTAALMGDGEKVARVRTWAVKKIHAAKRRGEKVDTDRARVGIILSTIQQEKVWVPDPVGIEYTPGAHLMACDEDSDNPEGVCIQGDDCDGACVLCAACFLSIGVHTAIVGHAYNDKKHIQHVICAAQCDGQWLRADPSYDFALGKCAPYTRERWISIPDGKVVCDAASCERVLAGYDPDDAYVAQGGGAFIGVDGLPRAEAMVVRWLGTPRERA